MGPHPIWSFFFKEFAHRYKRTPKIGSTGALPVWERAVADALKQATFPYVTVNLAVLGQSDTNIGEPKRKSAGALL